MTATSEPDVRVRARITVLFAIYLVLLVWIVLWKLDVPWIGGVDRAVKLVPFASTADWGASKPSEVLLNFGLFVPFGFYLGLLAQSWPWWRIAGVVAGASLLLEAAQYVLAIGSSDVTDVIVNTGGGLAGLGLLALLRRGSRPGVARVALRICTIATVLAVLACAAFIASPVRFSPPPTGPSIDRPVVG